MKQYIVDAFTDKVFRGNPAAVCVMEKWREDECLRNLAAENNLSETAFVVKEETGYHLRWFTPAAEVDICGHATLAAAFVILNFYDEANGVAFNTRSGELKVVRRGDLYEMDFPAFELNEIPVTKKMAEAFGALPLKALLGKDLICVFENEKIVRRMVPKQDLLQELAGRIQNATAKGSEFDSVSRSFAPKLAIPEDPVCGSAHCQIADFWSRELKKQNLVCYQASKRGGELYCSVLGNGRIKISGKAALFAISELKI